MTELVLLVACLTLGAFGAAPGPTGPAEATSVTEDEDALELGRKVLALREAIRNPGAPDAMKAVTDLGLDQRYYVMVRGWLAYQLRGDRSIRDASGEQTPRAVRQRIAFLEDAIRAIDLE